MSEVTSTTGSTGSGGGNSIRITGLNSGLDVDALVKKMLSADQIRVDRAKQQQQLITWKQEAYNEIISNIKELQEKYLNVLNTETYLLSSNNYNNMTATSSNTTVVSAKASAAAAAGTYKISVSQLAQASSITGNTLNSQVQITDKNASFNAADWQGKSISFNVGDTEYKITLDTDNFSNLNDVVSNINKKIGLDPNLNGKISASFINIDNGSSDLSTGDYIKFNALTSTSVKIVNDTGSGYTTDVSNLNSLFDKNIVNISSNTKLNDLTDLGTELNGNIVMNLKYNGNEVSVNLDNSSTGKNGSATVGDLITAIKNATGGAVTGKFDDMTGKFTLETTATGSTSSIQITETGSNGNTNTDLLTALRLPAVGSSEALSQGKDALVSITQPGSSTATTLTESSNDFTVNGVTYSITGVTAADSPVSVSVTKDTSKMHDLVSDFLDEYNKIIQEIETKLSEKKDYDYSPLTDAQKEDMSDTEIANWEKKAKQGVLRNDNNLQSLLTSLRSAFTSPVLDSSGNSVSSVYFGSIGDNALGIDTSNDYKKGSQIVIEDDDQFTKMITEHADEIAKLFTATSTSTDSSEKFKQSGIFERISNIITDNVGVIGSTFNNGTLTKYANVQEDYSITGGAGTGSLPDQIYQKQILIDKLTDLMEDHETKYYNQFSALETALQNLSAQQSFIYSYFSG